MHLHVYHHCGFNFVATLFALLSTCPSPAPSGAPQNFRARDTRRTSITLVWQPPPASQQNGIITNYTVRVTPTVESQYTVMTTELLLIVSPLLGNSPYTFAVAASTVVGIGPYSSPITASTEGPGVLLLWMLQIESLKHNVLRNLLENQEWLIHFLLKIIVHTTRVQIPYMVNQKICLCYPINICASDGYDCMESLSHNCTVFLQM